MTDQSSSPKDEPTTEHEIEDSDIIVEMNGETGVINIWRKSYADETFQFRAKEAMGVAAIICAFMAEHMEKDD